MRRKRKPEVGKMWINPNSTLSRGYVAWDRRKTDSMNARYLDLAEVALRTKTAQRREPAIQSESRKPADSPKRGPGQTDRAAVSGRAVNQLVP
ncbi:MAG TPA: hypothetical protein VIW67_09730 [Terriglobales bacterium]